MRILLALVVPLLFVVSANITHAQDAARPTVLIIGDSISIGYTPGVTAGLKEVAEVRRIPVNGANTKVGLANIDAWLGETKWAVIHFNWGLHDLVEGGTAVPLPEYRENLEKLVLRLKKTDAVLIFATTTPVPEKNGRKRRDSDVVAYNAAAVEIMKKHGVLVNDLYTATKPNLAEWQLKDDVHFQKAGSEGLAKEVIAAIKMALPVKK